MTDTPLWFPDPREANDDGLVAIGGDLGVERLLLAYRSGIFPWSCDPITWWSPDPRAIFEFDEFRISRSFAKTLRREPFDITLNKAFVEVMEGCATARTDGNWIGPEFIEAYTALHEAGHAHSIECWRDDELAGGVYGVSVGGLFAGESMFHRVSEASKVALHYLVEHLRQQGFALFDIQMVTPITSQLGARHISRDEYLERLQDAVELECAFGDE
jgi:leucyl/phenylalanyl-tRNA--protein transferase